MSDASSERPTGKPFQKFETHEETERFVAEANLADFDFAGFEPMRFEIEKRARQVNLRMPENLFAALKARVKEHDIPYQRLIREATEKALG